MAFLPDFSTIEESIETPLLVHRHGETPGRALIILIHGLGGSRYRTWTPDGEDPATASLPKFLYDDIATLDVGLYAYRTLTGRLWGAQSVELDQEARVLAERIRQQAESYGTVVLAGHSMGGILARAAVCELIKRNDRAALGAIKGLFLLATPQAGSLRVPRLLSSLSADARALRPHGPLVTEVQGVFTNRVVAEREHATDGQFFIPAYVVIAGEDQWVDPFSAGLSVPSQRIWTVRRDHTGAVKPRRRDDDEYVWVRDRVKEIVETEDAAAAPDVANPFEACDLRGKLFINRLPLRNALRDIVSPGGATRVVAVGGPSRSGKSHSIYLIEHIEQVGTYEKAVVRLERNQSPVTMTPTLLAQSILDLIGGDASRVPPSSPDVGETRWIARMADYTVGQIKARPRVVLVVLDGFADPNLPAQTKQFVQELVKRADREPNLRMALLDYSEDLLALDVAGRLATEPIGSFTEDDLRNFFIAYATTQGIAQLPAAATTTIVNAILARLPPTERPHNDSVAAAVEVWTRRLKGAPRQAWTPDRLLVLADEIAKAATTAAAAPVSPRRDERYHAAAALVTSFTLDPSLHVGTAAANLQADSVQVAGEGPPRWSLTREARKRTLQRLQTVAAMQAALPPQASRPDDIVQRTLERWLLGAPAPLDEETSEGLSATLQVIDWFGDTELRTILPAVDEVRTRVELAALLDPLRTLAGNHFSGRSLELRALRAYTGTAGGVSDVIERPPLLIFGPGGMGKTTLMARFVLESRGRLPFVYLDCDRPGLSAEEPITFLAEAVRQLGLQVPAFYATAQQLRQRWLQDIARDYGTTTDAHRPTTRGRTRHLEEFKVFVRDDLGLGDQPLLLVIDTFEEVQYRSTAAVQEVFTFLGELQQLLPRLRTVLAGRNPVQGFRSEPMEIGELDDESAQALLEALGIASPDVRRTLVRLLHGNPLSLRLAAHVAALQPGRALDDLERLTDDTEIQGLLYNRILGHVHHDEVRRLAHPGLVLRRITAEIIRKVLAGPCGLGDADEARAAQLFGWLGEELSLVTREGSAVRHRADVRRVMLPAVRKDRRDTVRAVEEAAVQYYADFDDVTSRAEEIYHRLALGQPQAEIDARWLPGIEEALRSAVDELEGPGRAYLAARLRIELDDQDWDAVDQATWEVHVAKRVEDLLRLDRPLEAVRMLRRRSARLPGTPLYWLQAQALSRSGQTLEARELAQQAVGAALGDPRWSEAFESREDAWTVDQLVEWFTTPSLVNAPSSEDIRVQIKWLGRLQPLHVLAGRSFVGRDNELAAIESYVWGGGRVPDLLERPPLLVQGLGGTGKSALIAKFLLDRRASISFVYLDCYALNPSQTQTPTQTHPVPRMLKEALHQIGLQHAGHRTAELMAENVPEDASSFESVADILPDERVCVFVIDAIELLGYRSASFTTDIYAALAALQRLRPLLRTILISRTGLGALPHDTLVVGALDAEAVHAYLAAEGIEPEELRQKVMDATGGGAAALRLAVELIRREGPQAFEGGFGSGAAILAALTQRLFAHMADPEVKAIAAPLLMLQRITPGVIRHVLAPIAGIAVDTDEKARALFAALEEEAPLFTRDGAALRPRGEIRRVVGGRFRLEHPELAGSLDQAAVHYYEAKTGVPARAEEIFHRLMLAQSVEAVDARWMPGVEQALRGAVDDLGGPARAYLAARLGLDSPEIDWSASDQVTWERYIATRVHALVELGRDADALDLLRQRSTRLPRSPLYALEASIVLRTGQPRDALLVAQRGLVAWPDDPALQGIVAECEALLGAAETAPRPVVPGPAAAPASSFQVRHSTEVKALEEVLAAALPTSTDILMLLQHLQVRPSVLPAPTAAALVAWAHQEGRLDDLVTAAADYRPDSRELQAFLTESTVRVDSRATDPIAAVRISGGGMVFGRGALRHFLRGIVGDVTRYPLLVVNGPPGSGKSHTARLADHVARATGRFEFAVLSVDELTAPADLARAVHEALSWRWEEPAAASPFPSARMSTQYRDIIRARARSEQRRILLMFDIERNARPEAVDFVRLLALESEPLALIITGLEREQVPREALHRTLFENLAYLSPDDVDDGVRQLARDLQVPFEALAGEGAVPPAAPGPGFNKQVADAMREHVAQVIESRAQPRS